jgi:hypothetical protein
VAVVRQELGCDSRWEDWGVTVVGEDLVVRVVMTLTGPQCDSRSHSQFSVAFLL